MLGEPEMFSGDRGDRLGPNSCGGAGCDGGRAAPRAAFTYSQLCALCVPASVRRWGARTVTLEVFLRL